MDNTKWLTGSLSTQNLDFRLGWYSEAWISLSEMSDKYPVGSHGDFKRKP